MLNIITSDAVTLYLSEGPRTFSRSSILGQEIVDLIRSSASNELIENKVLAFKNAVESAHKDIKVVDNDIVQFRGEWVPRQLGLKMKEFVDQSLDIKFLINFWHKLKENPIEQNIYRLFDYLEFNKHPIFPDGDFLAYKRVRGILEQPETYVDVHSGKFSNSPGKIVKIDRSQVDINIDRVCSYGLHVANFSYAKSFYPNGILLETKVSPYNVCAIPREYNNQKIRVCEYLVLKVIDDERKELVYSDDDWDVSSSEYEQLI